jgi:hypothetical protein
MTVDPCARAIGRAVDRDDRGAADPEGPRGRLPGA